MERPIITIKCVTPHTTHVLTPQDLQRLLGIDPNEISGARISLCIERNETSIEAHADTEAADYPAITIDGHDRGNTMFLAQAELPNEDFPDSVTARLYAGYAGIESGLPTAVCRHKLHNTDELAASQDKWGDKPPIKIVYVNQDTAVARRTPDHEPWPWPEHVGDEAPGKENT